MEKKRNEINLEAGNHIITSNKLIAEFMVGFIREGYNHPYQYVDFKDENGIFNETVRTDNLKYHSSFDWLMPVVEKIQSIDITPPPNYKGYRIEIVVQGYVKISGFPMPPIFTNVSIEGSLIKAVWKAVIQFIQWYNQNTTSPSPGRN